jgi:hypothetical protein
VRRARPPAAVRVTTPRLSRVQKANVEPLTELNAFFTEHQRCGALDAGVDWPIVWIACDCGARMARAAPTEGRHRRPATHEVEGRGDSKWVVAW